MKYYWIYSNIYQFFIYFDVFFGLNIRFNKLLTQEFNKFHLDMRFLSRTRSQRVYQKYVPYIINRIQSIHLSNGSHTPQGIQLFLSQSYQLRQFSNLKSITLSYLRSDELFNEIINECSDLPNLTHLTLLEGLVNVDTSNHECVVNRIWCLSKLKSCQFNLNHICQNYLSIPTTISKSLNYLILEGTELSLSTLHSLCQSTPCLKYLSTTLFDNSYPLEMSLTNLSITRLKILYGNSMIVFEHLLKTLPNLNHLTFQSYSIHMNGHQWEEMIRKYLPKLKILQFRMELLLYNHRDKENYLNQITDSFRTDFWINEHQWFVQCLWSTSHDSDQSAVIETFTLPYVFKGLYTKRKYILEKSTYPYNTNEYVKCDQVTNLSYNSPDFENPILSRFRFNNIQSLSLLLPFDEQVLLTVLKLDRVISLDVSIDEKKNLSKFQPQLQFILDRTPCLYSLSFSLWWQGHILLPVMEYRSASVRELDFGRLHPHNEWYYFDEDECIQLSRSSLAIQCETLIINVEYGRNILDLINNMPNLRALKVMCSDDNWTPNHNSVSPLIDEFVEWLHQQLASTCTITRNLYHSRSIKIWIC